MEIFANHAHVFPAEVRAEGSIESLLRLLDACGIARAVCFAPFRQQVEEAGYAEPNEWLVEAIADEPRLAGFAAINPTEDDSIARLERGREMGLLGVKLHPAYEKFDVLDQRALQFYAAAEQMGVPLDFHTGPHWHRISDYHPLKFDEIAYLHPKLTMILEHVGARPFFEDTLAVLGNNVRPNEPGRLFAGITSVLNKDLQKLWYLGIERVAELIWLFGDGVAIYGLDFPYNSVELVKDDIEQLSSLDLPEEGLAKLFGGNLERAIGLGGD
jgi:predicted TIM-barrel fold metal-dependent hydrolase